MLRHKDNTKTQKTKVCLVRDVEPHGHIASYLQEWWHKERPFTLEKNCSNFFKFVVEGKERAALPSITIMPAKHSSFVSK